MKILVTGASGLLGTSLINEISNRSFFASTLDRVKFYNANLEERKSMLEGFDCILHAAANTNVEECEINPESCFKDNCYLTELLFNIANKNGAKFVFISSTGVYGRGKSVPYSEYDIASPTTIHHYSKYLSERIILNNCDALIIRTGWLFGGDINNPKNFVYNRIKEAQKTVGFLYANSSQIGSPTYAKDCAQRILDLIQDDCSGVFNVVNDLTASRFDYVREIIKLSAAPLEVLPVISSAFKRKADVSENESAISLRMKFQGRPKLRCWQEALADYMSDQGLLSSLSANNE